MNEPAALGAGGRENKGSFKKALEVASDTFKLKEAIKELNKGYWAQSTLAVKKSRREEICKLARMVAPQGIFLPLSKEIVEATACTEGSETGIGRPVLG